MFLCTTLQGSTTATRHVNHSEQSARRFCVLRRRTAKVCGGRERVNFRLVADMAREGTDGQLWLSPPAR
jgi:hypothetical protein